MRRSRSTDQANIERDKRGIPALEIQGWVESPHYDAATHRLVWSMAARQLAYAGCFINLFNLIPLSPFDGGRVTAVLSPRIWLLGVPVLVALFMVRPSPVLILVAVLAAPQLLKAWRYDPRDPANQAYYTISGESRLTYAACYVGLVAFLAIMTHDLHGMLGSVRAGASGL